jgi:hypothetical protein
VCIPLSAKITPGTPPPEMLDMASVQDISGVRDEYFKHMKALLDEPIGDRILLDKNPEFTLIVPHISRVFPEMKLVIAIRDPRDVCISCFMQALPITIVSSNYLSLKNTVAKYAMVIDTWIKIRSMTHTPWIEIRYEDAVADLQRQARRLLDFLQLPWDANVLEFHTRAQKKFVRSPSYEAVTRPIRNTAIGRWKNYAKYLEPYLDQLTPLCREFNYT